MSCPFKCVHVILAARAHATALLHFIAVPRSRENINGRVIWGEVNALAWVIAVGSVALVALALAVACASAAERDVLDMPAAAAAAAAVKAAERLFGVVRSAAAAAASALEDHAPCE